MKSTYRKPTIVSYDQEEIMDLIGPVKTQYCVSCSDVTASPATFLQGKVFDETDPFEVSVNTSGCTTFQQVEISVPGSAPFVFYQFNRADGSLTGDEWAVELDDFQFLDDRGTYPLVVTLIDDQGNATASCQATITVE